MRCGDSESTIDRRKILRSTAGLAVGTAGLAAASGSASATVEALYEALECTADGTWQAAPDGYPVLDLRGSTPTRLGDWPDDPRDLTIFVHGLGGDSDDGWKDQAYTFEQAARQNGWDPTQIAVLYNTGGDSLDWESSVDKAKTAGRRLADWLGGYAAENDVSSYRVVAHSLGGHVTGTLLNELDGDVVIDDVALLGPAVPKDSVCKDDGQYAPGIEASAEAVYNYRSWDDEVVCDLYSSVILGSGNDGLGCKAPDCGWFDSPPSNFEDNSVTFSVDGHCDYPRPDVGCVDEVVDDFGV
ncbi:esterase/lipase family protein [Natrinema marinum]|uniref:esterase/lipase family protein n=1 Tax=Natrinema marinum TaxID=2961598 RepID=UPI0020C86FC2|nr:alpha/beta hydrolase [Natrinema marinum]